MRARKETAAERTLRFERAEAAEKTAEKLLRTLGVADTEENEQRIMVDPVTGRLHVRAEDIERLLEMLQDARNAGVGPDRDRSND